MEKRWWDIGWLEPGERVWKEAEKIRRLRRKRRQRDSTIVSWLTRESNSSNFRFQLGKSWFFQGAQGRMEEAPKAQANGKALPFVFLLLLLPLLRSNSKVIWISKTGGKNREFEIHFGKLHSGYFASTTSRDQTRSQRSSVHSEGNSRRKTKQIDLPEKERKNER